MIWPMDACNTVPLHMELLESKGTGTPIMIMHGLFGAGRNWGQIGRQLAKDQPVALVDLRNHGQSPWAEAMDYATLGADILAAIQNTFQQPVLLIGHSMGGKAAMAAALLGKEHVAGLAVIDIAPVDYAQKPGQGHDHGRYIEAMQQVDLRQISRRRDVEAALATAVESPALRAFLAQNLVLDTKGQGAYWRLNLKALEKALPDILGWPEIFTSRHFDKPALLYAGGASDYVDKSGMMAFERFFPKGEICFIPGAGHWPHAEKPQEVADKLTSWVKSTV